MQVKSGSGGLLRSTTLTGVQKSTSSISVYGTDYQCSHPEHCSYGLVYCGVASWSPEACGKRARVMDAANCTATSTSAYIVSLVGRSMSRSGTLLVEMYDRIGDI